MSIHEERVENIEAALSDVRSQINQGRVNIKHIRFIANCLRNYGKVVDSAREDDAEGKVIKYLRCVLDYYFHSQSRVNFLNRLEAGEAKERRERQATPTKTVQMPKKVVSMTKPKQQQQQPVVQVSAKGRIVRPEKTSAVKKPSPLPEPRNNTPKTPVKKVPLSPSFGRPQSPFLARSYVPGAKATPTKKVDNVTTSRPHVSQNRSELKATPTKSARRSSIRSLSISENVQQRDSPKRSLSRNVKEAGKAATSKKEVPQEAKKSKTPMVSIRNPQVTFGKKCPVEATVKAKATPTGKTRTPMKSASKQEEAIRGNVQGVPLEPYFDEFQDYFNKKLSALNTIVRSSQSMTERARERLSHV
eukprot:TRINITY_DN3950_c0_g1_i4.p1 TRINITY_DN3950_c0_g1~~TRINITY_DN3950_c0_g1_i4.p1  ORF type:complete len:360 (+),score=90.57 TRINITY_DN3950_c0_g1_i4:98-1177(+)